VHRLVELAGTLPGFLAYLAVLLVLGGLAAWEIVRGRGDRAFGWVVVLLLASLTFRFGDDTGHHVYRVAVLAEQLRSGTPSLLVTNPVSGEVLPIFVYYSFVPYLPAVALDLAGFTAHVAFRLAMGLALIVMALGLVRLIRLARGRETHAAFLAAILFLCSNYVYNLWLARQAYAEIWVYCLIPWVTLTLIQLRALAPLVALLFLQMTGHPLVFLQAFACSLLIAWALSEESPVALLRRYAGATALTVLLALPFWLPQALWQSLIQGPAALPVRFADTFLSFRELVDWRFVRGLGFALSIAVVLAIVLARARLTGRAWMLAAAVLSALAIQTEPLRPLAERLPLLPTSLFVWRLMLPAALLAFAFLLVAWPSRPRRDAVLAALALLSLASMGAMLATLAPDGLQRLANRATDDAAWIRQYATTETVWGRAEFLPNYAGLPERCGDAPPVSFSDLQRGIPARSDLIAVRAAPLAGLDYSSDGARVLPMACGDDLTLGPLRPGSILQVSQPKLTLVLTARIVALVLCVTIAGLWFGLRRRAVRRRAA
jgi:hypothetical protein